MPLLSPATGGSYLKAGILGFAKAGKTHTAVELAIGVREFFKLDGPIAMFDTERGSDYWKSRVEARTGKPLLVVKSRALSDLIGTVEECLAGGISVLVADSITHVWREVCAAYLAEMQAAAKRRGWREPDALDPGDWGRIKQKWSAWPDLYLNSPLHIIVCGRAGYEYDTETDERGRRELVKTGVKMKVEGEFGFEPSLLVEMERDWSGDPPEMVARARVIGDRFDVLNGKSCDQPTFEFFRPVVELLQPANHTPVDTSIKTVFGLDETKTDDWKRERDQRVIVSEKISSAFKLALLDGKGAEDQRRRVEAMARYFNSTSWTEISERTPSPVLAAGLRRFMADYRLDAGDDLPADFRATEPPSPATSLRPRRRPQQMMPLRRPSSLARRLRRHGEPGGDGHGARASPRRRARDGLPLVQGEDRVRTIGGDGEADAVRARRRWRVGDRQRHGEPRRQGPGRAGRGRRADPAVDEPLRAVPRCANVEAAVKAPDSDSVIRLHPDDIRAIAVALARELRSGGSSPAGIGAPGERNPWSDEKKTTTNQRGSMDPRSTDAGSESPSSLDEEEEGETL